MTFYVLNLCTKIIQSIPLKPLKVNFQYAIIELGIFCYRIRLKGIHEHVRYRGYNE